MLFRSAASPAAQAVSVTAWELAARYQFEPQLAGIARYSRSYRFANVDETYETSPAFTQQFQFLRPQINLASEAGLEYKVARASARATTCAPQGTGKVWLVAVMRALPETEG